MKTLVTSLALALPLLARAHPGHGIETTSAHFHATDVWGWVALALVAAVAVTWGRRK